MMTSDIFISLISSVIGGTITAGANLWLARQQHINNIKNIKFEKNRAALQDLKANHLRLKRTMLVLEESINLHENNFMPTDMYEENFSWAIVTLSDTIVENTTLHDQQLDFQIDDFSSLYFDIEYFLTPLLLKKYDYNSKITYLNVCTFDSLQSRIDEVLKNIKDTIESINE